MANAKSLARKLGNPVAAVGAASAKREAEKNDSRAAPAPRAKPGKAGSAERKPASK